MEYETWKVTPQWGWAGMAQWVVALISSHRCWSSAPFSKCFKNPSSDGDQFMLLSPSNSLVRYEWKSLNKIRAKKGLNIIECTFYISSCKYIYHVISRNIVYLSIEHAVIWFFNIITDYHLCGADMIGLSVYNERMKKKYLIPTINGTSQAKIDIWKMKKKQ